MGENLKIREVKLDLERRNIPWKKVVPPLWRLFWRCGWAVPPPMFVGFAANFVMAWLSFWAIAAVGDVVLHWPPQGSPGWDIARWGIAGVWVGYMDASKTQQDAVGHEVPRWKDFG